MIGKNCISEGQNLSWLKISISVCVKLMENGVNFIGNSCKSWSRLRDSNRLRVVDEIFNRSAAFEMGDFTITIFIVLSHEVIELLSCNRWSSTVSKNSITQLFNLRYIENTISVSVEFMENGVNFITNTSEYWSRLRPSNRLRVVDVIFDDFYTFGHGNSS